MFGRFNVQEAGRVCNIIYPLDKPFNSLQVLNSRLFHYPAISHMEKRLNGLYVTNVQDGGDG